jgi:hypothetical protein
MPDPVVLVGAVITGVGVLAAILLPLTLLVPDARGKTGFLVVPLAAAAFLAVWYAVVDTLASAGGFQNASGGVPPITLALAVPLAIGFAAAWLVQPVRETLLTPAIQPMLIAIQTYRIAGIGLVVLVALGQLPAIFGIPAGLGDFLVGLTAFSAAAAVKQGRPERAIWWNCLGLLDLGVALTLGVGTAPSALHFISATPTSTLLTQAPFVLVPSFLVPLDIWQHAMSLRFLLANRAQTRRAIPVMRPSAA